MSSIILWSVCLQCGCEQHAGFTSHPNPSAEEALDQAKTYGWREVNGVLICGNCVRKIMPQIKTPCK